MCQFATQLGTKLFLPLVTQICFSRQDMSLWHATYSYCVLHVPFALRARNCVHMIQLEDWAEYILMYVQTEDYH